MFKKEKESNGGQITCVRRKMGQRVALGRNGTCCDIIKDEHLSGLDIYIGNEEMMHKS